jgi:hypothetical protein
MSMVRLSDEVRQERLYKTMGLCHLRREGTASEDEIARRLDFRDSLDACSAQAMYEELESWGLPEWLVYPPGAAERAERRGKKPEEKKERKARGTGGAEELPSAGRAVDLFRRDLERLAYYLDELPGLKEQLQAERFVSSFWVGEEWEDYPRSEFSEEEWRRLCERHGEDPGEEVIRVPIDPIKPQGATRTPWEGLVPLIAVHVIMREPDDESVDGSVDGSVDDLLEALHPDPPSVDRAKLYGKRGTVDALRTSAENLAKTVRGVRVRPGHHPGKISDLDHWVALFLVTPLAEDGHSDEQIHAWIQKKHPSLGQLYTVEDVARLRALRLPPPDRVPPQDLP